MPMFIFWGRSRDGLVEPPKVKKANILTIPFLMKKDLLNIDNNLIDMAGGRLSEPPSLNRGSASDFLNSLKHLQTNSTSCFIICNSSVSELLVFITRLKF